jgi:uncharacterized protein (TIGR02118 family)
MIRVSVLYKSGDDVTFDHDYYLNKHIAMVAEKCGDKLKGVQVDRGLMGREPGSPPPYVAVAHLLFDSVEEFGAAFAPHGEAFAADVANYTNTTADIQISEVAR